GLNPRLAERQAPPGTCYPARMSSVVQPIARGQVGVGRPRRGRLFYFWVPLGLFIVITLFPFYWMLLASFKGNPELYDLKLFPFFFNPPYVYTWGPLRFAAFWTIEPTFEHYRFLFAQTIYAQWLKNTLIVSISSTAISLTCSVLAGYALARLRF